MSIPDTYDTLSSHLCQVLCDHRVTQVRNLALWVWGLLCAGHCALGRVADQLPIEGTKESRIQRLKGQVSAFGGHLGTYFCQLH